MKTHIKPTMGRSTRTVIGLTILAVSLGAPLLTPAPASARGAKVAYNDAWPGRRVVFLLPLQLGDKWNADVLWGQKALLAPAQHRLRQALEATGKFSVIEPFRFDPMLQRAVQEKLIDKGTLEGLIDAPTIQTANDVLEKLGYKENDAFIVEVALEEITSSGDVKAPTVQMQVTGKLYGLKSQSAKQSTARSDPMRRTTSPNVQVIDAAANAFGIMSEEFVRAPADVKLPHNDPPPVVKPVVKPTKSPTPLPKPKPAAVPPARPPLAGGKR